MGPATAEGEVGGGAAEIGDGVDVGKVGADDQCGSAQRGAPAEPAAGQAGADEGVADRVYASLASSSSCTLPLSAPDTGHPSLAASAALANAA